MIKQENDLLGAHQESGRGQDYLERLLRHNIERIMLLAATRTEWGLNCQCQAIQSLLPLAPEEVAIISISAAHKKI